MDASVWQSAVMLLKSDGSNAFDAAMELARVCEGSDPHRAADWIVIAHAINEFTRGRCSDDTLH